MPALPEACDILLVQDNPLEVELTLRPLREVAAEAVIGVAGDGEEALDYLYARGKFAQRAPGNPIVILLDLKMPKIDGLEVLRMLKADAGLKAVPVVMLTSSREEQDLVRSYALGVNAYVVKPVNFQQFVASVKQIGVFWAMHNEPPPGSIRRSS